jgi:hypothetical protein
LGEKTQKAGQKNGENLKDRGRKKKEKEKKQSS